jgi:putative ABC transport system substrate-binding protein
LWIGGAAAQSEAKLPQIGMLVWSSCGEDPDLTAGLADWNRIPGKNVEIVCESAGSRYEGFIQAAKKLVEQKVDVIVTSSQPAGRAAHEVTKTIPIVTIISGDPVGGGLANSLAKPGGNLTGVTYYATELTGKRLEILKEAVPALGVIGVLANPDLSYLPFEEDTKRAAAILHIRPMFAYVRDPSEFADAFRRMKSEGAEAIFVLPDLVLAQNGQEIADLALASKLPGMSWGTWFTQQGMMISYSADYGAMTRRLGFYVDQVLRGISPAELPIEQPRNFILSINVKTAQKLGIALPQSLLSRADMVIE